MDLKLLECFLAAADDLHFGRAAQRLGILPSALGRNVRLLEEELGLRLFTRSTRHVGLTKAGQAMVREAREVLARADQAFASVKAAAQASERVFRIGAIDSAATGLIPRLMHDFKQARPGIEVALVEDRTIRLLPRLVSGALDVAFVRPPPAPHPAIVFEFLLDEPTVVALHASHPLSDRAELTIGDLVDMPLIVPSPRNRPHSYGLTMRLFAQAGLEPRIVQQAEEKHTIVRLVAAGLGAALVPYWTSRIVAEGVVYRPLVGNEGRPICQLPLAAAWVEGTQDSNRDVLMHLVGGNLAAYAE